MTQDVAQADGNGAALSRYPQLNTDIFTLGGQCCRHSDENDLPFCTRKRDD